MENFEKQNGLPSETGMQQHPAESAVREEKSGGATIVDFNYEKYAEVERQATHTDATAALVLGILSLVMALFSAVIALIVGIVGIVFGVKGRRDRQRQGMATAGLVLSILGVILSVLRILATLFFITFYAVDLLSYL